MLHTDYIPIYIRTTILGEIVVSLSLRFLNSNRIFPNVVSSETRSRREAKGKTSSPRRRERDHHRPWSTEAKSGGRTQHRSYKRLFRGSDGRLNIQRASGGAAINIDFIKSGFLPWPATGQLSPRGSRKYARLACHAATGRGFSSSSRIWPTCTALFRIRALHSRE